MVPAVVVAYPREGGLSAPLISGIPAVVAYPRVGGLSAPLAGCSSPSRTLHTL